MCDQKLAGVYKNKAKSLYYLGGDNNLNEAILNFNKSLEINPLDSKAHFGKAVTLADLKRLNEALESYDKTIELDSNYEKSYLNKGLILMVNNKLRNPSKGEKAKQL